MSDKAARSAELKVIFPLCQVPRTRPTAQADVCCGKLWDLSTVNYIGVTGLTGLTLQPEHVPE